MGSSIGQVLRVPATTDFGARLRLVLDALGAREARTETRRWTDPSP